MSYRNEILGFLEQHGTTCQSVSLLLLKVLCSFEHFLYYGPKTSIVELGPQVNSIFYGFAYSLHEVSDRFFKNVSVYVSMRTLSVFLTFPRAAANLAEFF